MSTRTFDLTEPEILKQSERGNGRLQRGAGVAGVGASQHFKQQPQPQHETQPVEHSRRSTVGSQCASRRRGRDRGETCCDSAGRCSGRPAAMRLRSTARARTRPIAGYAFLTALRGTRPLPQRRPLRSRRPPEPRPPATDLWCSTVIFYRVITRDTQYKT